MAASACIALGYSTFYFEVKLPNGSTGQLLDVMDYISNPYTKYPKSSDFDRYYINAYITVRILGLDTFKQLII